MANERIRMRYSAQMLADSETAEVMLYGEIVPDGWRWSESDQSAYAFDKQIKEMRAAGATKAHLRVNCPGGAVNEAVAMRSALMNAGFDELTATIEGMCASAATVPIAIPGMHVRIAPGSEVMIHNPSGGVWGDAEEMEKGAARMRKLEESVAKLYAERTGHSEDEVREWMAAETWMTPEEAVVNGFADEVIETKADEPQPEMRAGGMLAAMMCAYRHVPERLTKMCADEACEDDGSTGAEEVADAPTANTNQTDREEDEDEMDVTQMTAEQLQAGNPELYASMMRQAAEAERARCAEIDEMTEPGYEQMAADAKAKGTSPMEYYKQMVAVKQKKRTDYRNARMEETAPAADVAGGDAGDNDAGRGENDELEAYKAEMKAFGAQMRSKGNGMF